MGATKLSIYLETNKFLSRKCASENENSIFGVFLLNLQHRAESTARHLSGRESSEEYVVEGVFGLFAPAARHF